MPAPKGLKVGDTFNEGNLVYKVTAIVGENYEATWTGATPSVAPVVKAEPKEEVKEDIDYLSMPYAQLKKLCADKGLDAKGTKADLIARLEK